MKMLTTAIDPSRSAEYLEAPAKGRDAVGDAALEALIVRHEGRVFALAKAILKRPEWAEDATQETFLRIVQQSSRGEVPTTGLDLWVLRIARSVAIGLWRKRRVRGETGFDERERAETPPPDSEFSPLQCAIAAEESARVMAAIDDLPGPVREVLMLRFFHGLEPAAIGQVIGCGGSAARVRLWRALKELRRRLRIPDKAQIDKRKSEV